jgi:hypothetical protein
MNNNVVVLSGKEEYRDAVKSFIENSLCLDNICLVEADHALGNPGIIEREHGEGKNIIIVGGNRREIDFLEITSLSSNFFRQERVFWAEDLPQLKNLKCFNFEHYPLFYFSAFSTFKNSFSFADTLA